MMEHTLFKPTVIATLLLLSACTKTVYQPVPANQEQTTASTTQNTATNATSATTVPGNTAAASTPLNDPTGTTSTTSNTPTASNTTNTTPDNTAVATAGVNTAQVNASVAAAANTGTASTITPAVIGAPGDIVDCEQLLPCRWVSAEQDFTLTVGNVDNTGTLGRLSVDYTLNTSHDTELILGNGSTALAPGGQSFNLVQQALGESNGIAPQAVLAGQNIIGSATYDRAADSASLAGWTLTIVDNGLPRTVGFINLPVGTPNALAVNCAGVLPCQWESPNKDVVLTLVTVGGYTANGRLNVNFNIVTTRDMDVVLDAGSTALSSGGEMFEGRTHGWGLNSGFAEVVDSASTGVMLPGTVSFFRTASPPTALTSLDLVMYEDTPSQRWNPQFINLPTQ